MKNTEIFTKNDNKKPQIGLVPPLALLSVARVLGHSAEKYGPYNWIESPSQVRYMSACLRHCMAWLAGEDIDPESGETHLAEAICSLLFLEEFRQRGYWENDDRFNNNEFGDGPTHTHNYVCDQLNDLIGGTRLQSVIQDQTPEYVFSIPTEEKTTSQIHTEALNSFRSLSQEEKISRLKEYGILNSAGRLSWRYGGEDEPPFPMDHDYRYEELEDETIIEDLSKPTNDICPKCNGAGWLWWNELDEYNGPASDVHDCYGDDTRYRCDRCSKSF